MRQKANAIAWVLVSWWLAMVLPGVSQTVTPTSPRVHFIWMGGNDCPPCVHWRATELPKLRASPEFQSIKFHYVTKVIKSPVPSKIFLPPEVRPFKELLDLASGGRGGSPQSAIIVNGEVFDYFRGPRSAQDIVSMLRSIRTKSAYPFKRCIKFAPNSRKCEIRG